MSAQRIERVNRVLLRMLSELVPGVIRDPRVQAPDMVVVKDIRTSPDLKHASVFVSIQHSDENVISEAMRGLQAAQRYLRRELGSRVELRSTPELRFVLDVQNENARRIDEILGELAHEERPRNITLEDACLTIRSAERILVTTHPDPDGDAIGSAVAMAAGLSRIGKHVDLFNPDPVPARFQFLAGVDLFSRTFSENDSYDLTIMLDCSDARMFGGALPSRTTLGQILVLDHHKTSGDVADVQYRDPKAAATGVIVYRVLEALGVALDVPISEAIYCSILCDTGSFRYRNTDPEAMRVSAKLLEKGVNTWRVASHVYESRPLAQLRLLSMVLGTLQISADGLSAALRVSDDMLQETGCTSDMVDGFINYARSLNGVEVGVLVRERENGGCRVSLRSRGLVDVSDIASALGGGGHHNAAGFVTEKDTDELLADLFCEVSARCQKHTANMFSDNKQ